jgi:DNA polymerase-4
VVLRLRLGYEHRISRSASLPRATRSTATVLRTARALLDAARPATTGHDLTLLGVALTGLRADDAAQLELPLDGRPPGLDDVVDAVRERFGTGALRRAVLLNRRAGFEMPVLPDEPG